MSKILVVGGSGFLGTAIFQCMEKEHSAELYCADLIPPGAQRVKFIETDLLSAEHMARLESIGFDHIINCSGQVTKPINTCYQLNTTGMTNILRLVRNTGSQFVQISSASVYGPAERAREESPFNPETPYSCCKAFAEYLITSSLDPSSYTIFRLSNLYGPKQQKGVISYLLRAHKSDRKLVFNNDGSLVRYFLHTEDCARIIKKAIFEKPLEGTYNLAGPDRFTLVELIDLMERMTNVKFETCFNAAPAYDNTLVVESEKISQKLTLEFRYTVEKYISNELR